MKQFHDSIWAEYLFLVSVLWTSVRLRVEGRWVMGPFVSLVGDVQLWPCRKLWRIQLFHQRVIWDYWHNSEQAMSWQNKSTESYTDELTLADWSFNMQEQTAPWTIGSVLKSTTAGFSDALVIDGVHTVPSWITLFLLYTENIWVWHQKMNMRQRSVFQLLFPGIYIKIGKTT